MNASDSKYMHEVDLGLPVDLRAALMDQRESEMVRSVLQYIRDKAAGADRLARVSPRTSAQENPQHPLEYRAFHGGAANALEELFFEILGQQEG